MKRKTIIRIFLGLAAFVLGVVLLIKVVVEPWIGRKIQASLNENAGDYLIKIEKVDVSILRSGIEFYNITLFSKSGKDGQVGLSGKIESVKIKGVHLLKAIFRKDIDIREVGIIKCQVEGGYTIKKKEGAAFVSPLNINVEKLFFEKLFVDVKDSATARYFFVKDGNFELFNIKFYQHDSLSPAIIGQLSFDASELKTVTADSLYTFTAVGINYSASSQALTTDSFAIHPNYSEYKFTDRHEYETDRFDGRFSQLSFYDFSAVDFIKSGKMSSSYIEIGELELNVFRDKRKEFRHVEKPTFQDEIYNYPGALNIDSIAILSGNIVYSEHGEKSHEKGSVWFNKVSSRIYNVSNDTIYQTEKGYLEWHVNAMLMGAGKLAVVLKSGIYNSQNSFTVNGTLWGMEVTQLNPILENNAFVSIKSGGINGLNFNISANNTKATGNMELLYQGLDFAVVNKQTGETSALVEQIKSMIANVIVMESNPMSGEEMRPGTIEYERDPEKFLFNYMVKALTTGVKTSITKEK